MEAETNIRLAYLTALEEGNYDLLPGRVYGVGFMRSYAKYLGLDPAPLIEAMKHDWKTEEEESPLVTEEREKAYSAPRTGGIVKYAGYGLAVAAIAGLVFVSARLPDKDQLEPNRPDGRVAINSTKPSGPAAADGTGALGSSGVLGASPGAQASNGAGADPVSLAPGLSPVEPAVAQPAANGEKAPGVPAVAPAPSGVAVTLRVVQDRCWMSVSQDGQPAYEGMVNVGDAMTFTGKDKVNVVLGNAGAVEVILNGKSLGTLGDVGQVIKEEFVPLTQNPG
ncbi:helix-turn-helix domain-containing protein [Heliomicrobium modesticaldum]|uniref:helix-turn-helix domain-containing protein n=1 Tax=Heliomicrobium modesticaldum TaxID=35701 RepID=UPI001F36D542|nr:RodZ domain-containing protein [Heliomicrobium modesticaldum]